MHIVALVMLVIGIVDMAHQRWFWIVMAYMALVMVYVRVRFRRRGGEEPHWNALDVVVLILPPLLSGLWGLWEVVVCGLAEFFAR